MTTVEQLWARSLSLQEPTPLGWEPREVTAIFSRGADWIVTFSATSPGNAVWPDGTTMTVNIFAADTDTDLLADLWPLEYTWAASIDGNAVAIRAPYDDTDTVENGAWCGSW